MNESLGKDPSDSTERLIIETSNQITVLFDDLICRRVGNVAMIIADDYQQSNAIFEEVYNSSPEIAKLEEALHWQERQQKMGLLSERFDTSGLDSNLHGFLAAMLVPDIGPKCQAPVEYAAVDEAKDQLEQELDDIAYNHDFETSWMNREQDIIRVRAYLDSDESMGLYLVASEGICRVIMQEEFSTKQQTLEQIESLPSLCTSVSTPTYSTFLENLYAMVENTKAYLETEIAAYDAGQ